MSSELNPNPTKVKALELAQQSGGSPAEVVTRATAYAGFLSGTAATAAKPATAAGPAPATGGKGATAAPGSAPTAGAKKTTEAPKTAEAKPATPPKAAAKPAAGGATGAPVPGDTKAPGGTHTYADVVAKLREAMLALDPVQQVGKEKALALLAKTGGGAKSVRDLKPGLYDAVVAAVDAALQESDPPEGGAGEPGFDDGTTQPETDELGLPVD